MRVRIPGALVSFFLNASPGHVTSGLWAFSSPLKNEGDKTTGLMIAHLDVSKAPHEPWLGGATEGQSVVSYRNSWEQIPTLLIWGQTWCSVTCAIKAKLQHRVLTIGALLLGIVPLPASLHGTRLPNSVASDGLQMRWTSKLWKHMVLLSDECLWLAI